MPGHIVLGQLIDLLTTQNIDMGNDGVKSERVGIVENTMVKRTECGFSLAYPNRPTEAE